MFLFFVIIVIINSAVEIFVQDFILSIKTLDFGSEEEFHHYY